MLSLAPFPGRIEDFEGVAQIERPPPTGCTASAATAGAGCQAAGVRVGGAVSILEPSGRWKENCWLPRARIENSPWWRARWWVEHSMIRLSGSVVPPSRQNRTWCACRCRVRPHAGCRQPRSRSNTNRNRVLVGRRRFRPHRNTTFLPPERVPTTARVDPPHDASSTSASEIAGPASRCAPVEESSVSAWMTISATGANSGIDTTVAMESAIATTASAMFEGTWRHRSVPVAFRGTSPSVMPAVSGRARSGSSAVRVRSYSLRTTPARNRAPSTGASRIVTANVPSSFHRHRALDSMCPLADSSSLRSMCLTDRTIFSTCAAVADSATDTSSSSRSGVATRIRARTFEYDNRPSANAACICGSSSKA